MFWRSLIDDLIDVLLDLSARRGRAVLLMVAVALSTGALVTAVGISMTASQQIGVDLAAQVLDEVTVMGAGADPNASQMDVESDVGTVLFTEGAEQRVDDIAMVEAVGLRLDIPVADSLPSRFEVPIDVEAPRLDVEILGATSGYLDAVDATVADGTEWMLDRTDSYRVVLLGPVAAETLGIPVAENLTGYRIRVNGHPAEVVGIVRSAGRQNLDRAVIVPYAEAAGMIGDAQTRMVVRTAQGAGANVSDIVRTAVRPDAPEKLVATRVVDLKELRLGVQNQLGRLAGTIGVLLLVLTGLLIANSMVVSVVSRTSEIGLRRALGASRFGVSRIFLLEGGIIGLLGGLAGAVLGTWAVVAVAAANDWGVVLSVVIAVSGPVLGLVIGVLASVYPSARAARISPAIAIRVD